MARLGQEGDIDAILAHPWYSSISIPDLLAKKLKPTFIPEIQNDTDTSNFDPQFQGQDIAESLLSPDKVKLIEEHKDAFEAL